MNLFFSGKNERLNLRNSTSVYFKSLARSDLTGHKVNFIIFQSSALTTGRAPLQQDSHPPKPELVCSLGKFAHCISIFRKPQCFAYRVLPAMPVLGANYSEILCSHCFFFLQNEHIFQESMSSWLYRVP